MRHHKQPTVSPNYLQRLQRGDAKAIYHAELEANFVAESITVFYLANNGLPDLTREVTFRALHTTKKATTTTNDPLTDNG